MLRGAFVYWLKRRLNVRDVLETTPGVVGQIYNAFERRCGRGVYISRGIREAGGIVSMEHFLGKILRYDAVPAIDVGPLKGI